MSSENPRSIASMESKLAAIQTISSEQATEVNPTLRIFRNETLRLIARLLKAAGINATIQINTHKIDVETPLSLEEIDQILQSLEIRFNTNKNLHEGCNWQKVQSALIANPKALQSINQMEKYGHMPDVYDFDELGFDVGTCSKEAPTSTTHCVYDTKAAKSLKDLDPSEYFEGNAVEMANTMGLKLMPADIYENILQAKGEFDLKGWVWVTKDHETPKPGNAFCGIRNDNNDGGFIYQHSAMNHGSSGGWRGTLRIQWA